MSTDIKDKWEQVVATWNTMKDTEAGAAFLDMLHRSREETGRVITKNSYDPIVEAALILYQYKPFLFSLFAHHVWLEQPLSETEGIWYNALARVYRRLVPQKNHPDPEEQGTMLGNEGWKKAAAWVKKHISQDKGKPRRDDNYWVERSNIKRELDDLSHERNNQKKVVRYFLDLGLTAYQFSDTNSKPRFKELSLKGRNLDNPINISYSFDDIEKVFGISEKSLLSLVRWHFSEDGLDFIDKRDGKVNDGKYIRIKVIVFYLLALIQSSVKTECRTNFTEARKKLSEIYGIAPLRAKKARKFRWTTMNPETLDQQDESEVIKACDEIAEKLRPILGEDNTKQIVNYFRANRNPDIVWAEAASTMVGILKEHSSDQADPMITDFIRIKVPNYQPAQPTNGQTGSAAIQERATVN